MQLRRTCADRFAFDMLRADGSRAVAGRAEPPEAVALLRPISIRLPGSDIDINRLDDILNPFCDTICISFLGWRECFVLCDLRLP